MPETGNQKLETRNMRKREPDAAVLYASSEIDADLYYATHFLAGDPVLYLEIAGKRTLVLSDLELGRGRKEARVDRVVSGSAIAKKIGKRETADVAAHLLGRRRRVRVPGGFPVELADALRRRGIRLTVKPAPFFEARIVKTNEEVAAIEQTQRATEEAFEEALKILRASRIRGDKLYWKGEIVTSELLRRAIHVALLERGCRAQNTIVAGGDQGCDPHCRGSGPIRPHRTIVFDIFPRSESTRYFADMSRTVVKGTPTPAARKLFDAVRSGQELGISKVRAGVNGRDVHAEIARHFQELGYRTERRGRGWVGFFHGTGHGVGLDIHESPWLLRQRDSTLPAGAVVTVEPGLYYPGVGAVRLEDMVLVTGSGCRNLTRFPKQLEV